MNRKVEIEMKPNAFVGLNKRSFPRYEVRGYLQVEGRGWTGVLLTSSFDSETSLTKTKALAMANEWFNISGEDAYRLVFGS